jgi:hypothetical protein
MSYEALLEELETLQKSMDQGDSDDEKIAAAAAAGDQDEDDEHDEPDGDEGMDGEGDGDGDGDEGPMAKSFSFQLDTGEVVEAIDGTELVKSLQGEVALLKSERETAATQTDKVFQAVLGQLKSQGQLIKSLSAQVEKLSSEGRGRKSIAAPNAAMAKSMGTDSGGLTPDRLLAKANAAFDAGRISGKELTVIDVSLRHGAALDDGLMARVLA